MKNWDEIKNKITTFIDSGDIEDWMVASVTSMLTKGDNDANRQKKFLFVIKSILEDTEFFSNYPNCICCNSKIHKNGLCKKHYLEDKANEKEKIEEEEREDRERREDMKRVEKESVAGEFFLLEGEYHTTTYYCQNCDGCYKVNYCEKCDLECYW